MLLSSLLHTCKLFFSGPPSFPVSASVTHDSDTNAVVSATTGSTVISWNPVLVSSGCVMYTVRIDGTVADSTGVTSTTLTGLEFNRQYSVSVEPVNTCGQLTGSPLQGTVEVPATGEYINVHLVYVHRSNG